MTATTGKRRAGVWVVERRTLFIRNSTWKPVAMVDTKKVAEDACVAWGRDFTRKKYRVRKYIREARSGK